MAYLLISWPESQHYMDLEGFEENSSLADEEKFGPCAYFVDEDWLDELEEEDDEELDELEEEDDEELVDRVVTDCYHTLDDEKEYEFAEPIELSENRIATKFWEDDGNEDVRVEIYQTYPTKAWREDAFLSSMDIADAVKVAKAIDTYWD